MVISSLFYLFYFILSFIIPLLSLKNVKHIGLLVSIIFAAQFSVTTFLKVGITVGFLEVALLLSFVVLLLKIPLKTLCFTSADKIFLIFIVCSILSVLIAYLRIFFRDLIPASEYDISPTIRSIMSLNKLFVFLPLFIIVRNLLFAHIKVEYSQKYFFLILAVSGIIPCLAVSFESINVGFTLIHNNPSFGEVFHLQAYNGTRAPGLSNEASFFAYQLFFSYMGAMEMFLKHPRYKKTMLLVMAFYWVILLITISRTGMLLFGAYTIYKYFQNSPLTFRAIFKIVIILTVTVLILSRITIQNFNLVDRFVSSFSVEADLSTIERYGVTNALYKLMIDKSSLLGVGIYNYQYYVKQYLPDYMSVIYYKPGQSPPSFNFILQLILELGVPLFLIMMISCFLVLKKTDRFVKEWFVFLFLFAMGFQVLNFTIPFIILLYPLNNEDNLHNRKY